MQKGLKQLQEVQKTRHVLITLDKKNYTSFIATVWWERRVYRQVSQTEQHPPLSLCHHP